MDHSADCSLNAYCQIVCCLVDGLLVAYILDVSVEWVSCVRRILNVTELASRRQLKITDFVGCSENVILILALGIPSYRGLVGLCNSPARHSLSGFSRELVQLGGCWQA